MSALVINFPMVARALTSRHRDRSVPLTTPGRPNGSAPVFPFNHS